MRTFLWNILLALTWALMTGKVNPTNLVVGFVLGYLTLMFTHGVSHRSPYFAKVWQVMGFACWFAWELVLSNLRVAHDVVTPTHHSKPGTLAIPLDARTPTEITMLANLITLTPGTLSLDVSDDRKILFIHAMFVDDPDELRRDIKEGLERRVLELMR